jgi:DNA-binding response OmpR family regulator
VRVLIADDDRELASAIASYVRRFNGDVVATVTSMGVDAVRNVERFKPDVVVMDIAMPYANGTNVCEYIRSIYPNTRIVLISGRFSESDPDILNSGAAAFLAKPSRMSEVSTVLTRVIQDVRDERNAA